MVVDVNELKIRRAKTRQSVANMKNKYGNGMNELSIKCFGGSVPLDVSSGSLLILHNEKPIGLCIYVKNTIYNVCVEENYRNNGICHLIIKECIKTMKPEVINNGFNCITLYSSNPIAQKIYTSMGFTEYDTYCGDVYYKLNI